MSGKASRYAHIDRDEFLAVWNAAKTRSAVAVRFGISPVLCSHLASNLRACGHAARRFSNQPTRGSRRLDWASGKGPDAPEAPKVIEKGRDKDPQPDKKSGPESILVNEAVDHGHLVVNTSRGPVNCLCPQDVRDISAADGPEVIYSWAVIRRPSKEMGEAITRHLVPRKGSPMRGPSPAPVAEHPLIEEIANRSHPFFSIAKGKVTVADIDARLHALRKKHMDSPDRQIDEAEAEEVASLRRRRQHLLEQTRYLLGGLLGGLFADDPEGDDE